MASAPLRGQNQHSSFGGTVATGGRQGTNARDGREGRDPTDGRRRRTGGTRGTGGTETRSSGRAGCFQLGFQKKKAFGPRGDPKAERETDCPHLGEPRLLAAFRLKVSDGSFQQAHGVGHVVDSETA